MSGQFYARSSSSLLLGAIRVDSDDRLAPALILIAILIAIISAIVVVYQCGSAAGWTSASQAAAAPVGLNQQQLAAILAGQAKQTDKLFYGPPPIQQYQQMAAANGTQTPITNLTGSLRFNSIQDPYAFRAAFNTLNGGTLTPTTDYQQQQQQQRQSRPQQQQQFPPINSKEYETQMLKMSVLFDDNHSLEEQNLNENQISTKNLV